MYEVLVLLPLWAGAGYWVARYLVRRVGINNFTKAESIGLFILCGPITQTLLFIALMSHLLECRD